MYALVGKDRLHGRRLTNDGEICLRLVALQQVAATGHG